MSNSFVKSNPTRNKGWDEKPTNGGFIDGLLGNPLFNFGTGLLAASGPSLQPVGFGQALAQAGQYTSQRQQQQLRLQAARDQIEQRRNQTQAREQLPGLLNTSNVPAGIRAPQGLLDQRTMETLSKAYPEAYGQAMVGGLLGQQQAPRVSTDMNTFEALNPQLTRGTPEYRQQYLDFVSDADPTGALMDQAQLELTMAQLEDIRDEREARNETANQNSVQTRRTIVSDLTKLEKMADLNNRLSGTFLETGVPFMEVRKAVANGVKSVQQLFGFDESRARQVTADFGKFDKFASDFMIGSLDRLSGTGAITNAKFDALVRANAGIGSTPETNNSIIAMNIAALLDGAKIEGIELENEQELRDLIQMLEGSPPSLPTPPPGFEVD